MVVALRYNARENGARVIRERRDSHGTRPVLEHVLQRVARGDPKAVRECVDRYAGLVWSLARRFARDDAEAEDAVQEVFVNLWRSAERFDPSVASETTFVAMIARRRLIDRARARARQPSSEALEESADLAPEAKVDPVQLNEDARRAGVALAQLSPDQQRVLRLSVYQGLSHEQISNATGLPLGTVKTHIRRGLIRVREILEAKDAGPAGLPASPPAGASANGGTP